MTCGKTKPPYCEDQEKAVKDKLREIKIHRDPSSGDFWEKAAYFLKYGTMDADGLAGIKRLESELTDLQAELLKCRVAHGLEEGTVVGFAKSVIKGLSSMVDW